MAPIEVLKICIAKFWIPFYSKTSNPEPPRNPHGPKIRNFARPIIFYRQYDILSFAKCFESLLVREFFGTVFGRLGFRFHYIAYYRKNTEQVYAFLVQIGGAGCRPQNSKRYKNE